MTRTGFSAVLFVFSIFFTVVAFSYPYTNNRGQVGAGFFPIWIGALMIIVAGYSLYKDMKIKDGTLSERVYLKALFIIIVLTGTFILALNVLGALLSMMIFIFVILYMFNRGRLVQNTLISVLVPVGIYLLLDVWLNAGLPGGLLK